jgi:hypothetical protein
MGNISPEGWLSQNKYHFAEELFLIFKVAFSMRNVLLVDILLIIVREG